jgi:hypothetical protein
MALTKVRGGGVDTVVLADSTNLNFGTGSDAKIFHDGNNTKFQHTGTGGLYVGADTFAITNGATDTNHISIDANGHITKPKQSAFMAKLGSNITNIARGADTTIVFDTEVFDQNADYNNSTGVFTAPVTGRYVFFFNTRTESIETDVTWWQWSMISSNNSNYILTSAEQFDATFTYFGQNQSMFLDMDANDTTKMVWYQNGGTNSIDINAASTKFAGYLVC